MHCTIPQAAEPVIETKTASINSKIEMTRGDSHRISSRCLAPSFERCQSRSGSRVERRFHLEQPLLEASKLDGGLNSSSSNVLNLSGSVPNSPMIAFWSFGSPRFCHSNRGGFQVEVCQSAWTCRTCGVCILSPEAWKNRASDITNR